MRGGKKSTTLKKKKKDEIYRVKRSGAMLMLLVPEEVNVVASCLQPTEGRSMTAYVRLIRLK
jgi:hypothetical protein